MRTSKPVSTISYNSPDYLKGKLMDWKKAGYIENAVAIFHKAEQGDTKDHFHVYIVPAKLLQTVDLENDSKEYDPTHPDKPLKMLNFRASKVVDWILYGLHDPVYLAGKGMEREYHYTEADLWSTDSDWLELQLQEAREAQNATVENRIAACVRAGMTWPQTVMTAGIPIHHMHNAKLYFEAVHQGHVEAAVAERDLTDANDIRTDMKRIEAQRCPF